MTAISWKNDISGNWTTAADWSTNSVPTAADDVTISTGQAYIVSITSNVTAKTLTFNTFGIYFGGAELLENAGSLTLTGALTLDNGLVVLNRANSIGGGVSLVRGVLSVGNNGALGTGALSMSSGELLGTATETLANYMNIGAGDEPPTIAAAHGTTLDIGSAGWGLEYYNLTANYGAPGEDGTVVLHNPGISTSGGAGGPGTSEVQAGTLIAGDANVGNLLQVLNVDSGATFDIAGSNVTLDGLQGKGTVKNSGAAAKLTLSSGNFAGSITGAISLVVDGTGDPTTLTGANTYTGTTTINTDAGPSGGGAGDGLDGILVLGTGGSIGSGAVDDENEFIIDSSTAVTLNNVISGAGQLNQEGTGTTSINNAANSYSGGTTISAGTLAVGNGSALGTGPITISGGELLGTANETLTNSLVLSGSFTIAAAHGTTLDLQSDLQLTQAAGDTWIFGAPGQDGTVVCDLQSIDIAEDDGVVEVRSGTLKAGTEGVFESTPDFGRQFIVDAGATFDLAGVSVGFHFPIFGLTGAGTVTNSGDTASLNLQGANFAGTISGPLSLEIQTTSLFSGLSDYSGDTHIDDLATLTDTGTFDLISNAGVLAYQPDVTGTFVNDGLFEKTAGGGISTVSTAFVNNGTITVLSGSIQFTGAFTNAGTINGIVTQSGGVTTISANAAVSNTRSNFNGDGTSDILFRNDATGDTGFFAVVNSFYGGWNDIGVSSTAYKAVGTGDFYNSGTDDVLYRNNTTGDTGLYKIVNGINTGWYDVGASNTAYSVVGIGDFNGDGTDDILYRNNSNGDTGFYGIVNGANTGWHDVGASSTAYSVVGVGDFTGDHTDDILYRNNTTGDTGFYKIVNGVNTGWHDVGVSNTAYSVVGVGDFNGDGTEDILYHNNSNGDTGFYAIVNGTNTGWHDLGVSPAGYSIVGTGNYLGNGTDDILLHNNANGDTGFYAIVNGVNTGWNDIGAASTAYHVVG